MSGSKPKPMPIDEIVLATLWLLLVENHMGEERIGTRDKILFRLFHEEEIKMSPRQLRQAFDQLNASRRIVCSTSLGTYIPTTDPEFERGYRYRHHMATALLKGCRIMREGWEAKKLKKAAREADERARGTQGALPGVVTQ